jgi:murein L,D-transpeptidase YafK
MKMRYSGLVFSILVLLWFTGCEEKVPYGKVGGHYSHFKKISFHPERSISKVVVKQKEHKMFVYHKGKLIRTLPVSLGKNTMKKGPKVRQGDFCTPVGTYKITSKRTHSIKYRAMDVSYPNAKDRTRAAKLGAKPGGYITIHGQPHWNKAGQGDFYTLKHDWTNGCIALTNKDLDWLWGGMRTGTTIVIER